MFSNDIGASAHSPTDRGESGTTAVDVHPVATLDHRTFVHPVPQPDCLECLPARCVCGQLLCPDAFEHRRSFVGAETSWREMSTR